jgi:hypothetical protein
MLDNFHSLAPVKFSISRDLIAGTRSKCYEVTETTRVMFLVRGQDLRRIVYSVPL